MFKSICFLFFSLPFFVFADSFYINEVAGTSSGVEIEEARNSFLQLVKNELSSSGHRVKSSPKKSQWVLTPSLLKLGSSYVVTISKEKNGQTVFSQKLKSRTLEDLDIVTERLVKSVVTEQKVAGTQGVDNITQEERKGTTVKTKVTRQFYVGFGPGNVSGLESDDSSVNWTLGYLWGIDHQFGLRLALEGTGGEGDASFGNFGVGGQYYLNRRKHAPYVLGLFGYSWAESNVPDPNCSFFCGGIDESGFSLQVGFGGHFFRTATVNIATELVYTRGLYDVLDENPGVVAARVLILW